MGALPERDEAEDLLCLLALPEIRVRIAEGPAVGILRQRNGVGSDMESRPSKVISE